METLTNNQPVFEEFNKIARLRRECVITEKIDGTNGQIYITESGDMFVGSRNRWLSEAADNFGFYKWAMGHKEMLLTLGPGRHYGEWWGAGIQRGYGQKEKHFSLFNTSRWNTVTPPPLCCLVVPVLYTGIFNTGDCCFWIQSLQNLGSHAAPGFMNPEGIVIYHTAARIYFKQTILNDEQPKSYANQHKSTQPS